MKVSTTLRRAVGLAVLVAAAVAVVPDAVPGHHVTPAAAATDLGAGGEYHALAPTRIYDSRTINPVNEANPGPKASSAAGTAFDIDLLNQGGVPADGTQVLAVAVSITVTNPSQAGYLAAYPSGTTPTTSSIVNFQKFQRVPNLAIVRPGSNGKLTLSLQSNVAGNADVFVDVFGWFSTSSAPDRGARLIPVIPGRILDTRQTSSPIGDNSFISVQIRGADAFNPTVTDIVPTGADVVGVLLNVTAVKPTAAQTFVSVVPEDPVGAPATSNLNLVAGQIKANTVLVPVGADGKIRIYNQAGNTDVIVDVVGYLMANVDVSTRAGRVIPLTTPFRAFDTRQPQFGGVPLGLHQSEDWSFAQFAGSVNIGGVSVGNQAALIGNLTNASLVGTTAASYLTAYPADAPSRPTVSNLNSVPGAAVPNLALLMYSSATTVRFYNDLGSAQYVLDVSAVVLAD